MSRARISSRRRITVVIVAAPFVAAVALSLVTSFSAPPVPVPVPVPDPDSPPPSPRETVAPPETPALRREPGTCTVIFPSDDAHLSEDSIALAVLDAFDPGSKRTATSSGDAEGAFATTSCRGTRLQAWARDDLKRGGVSVVTSLVGGPPELVDDAGLGSSVVARVIVGESDARAREALADECARPRGFIALATLRGRRVEIDALSEWEGTCGALEPLVAMRVGGEIALVEDDGDHDDEATHTHTEASRVWLRRGSSLVVAGTVRTSFEETRDDEDAAPIGAVLRTMTTELLPSPRGLVARETWTFEPIDADDPPDAATKTRTLDRLYVLDKLTLRALPASDPKP